MKKIALLYMFTVIYGLISAQSVYPGLFKSQIKTTHACESPAECFPLSDVRLLDGRMRRNLERDSAWIMSIPVVSLVHSFHNASGVPGGKEGGYMTVPKLGGWESLDCELRGHTTGHVMSALALLHAATGEDCFKIKGDSIVAELSKVQQAYGNGYLSAFPEELINRNIRGTSVWAPWYTLHKILAGLIDQYLYAGNQTALAVAQGMGDWAFQKTKDLDTPTRLKMLRNEFGGVNEALYNLYAVTGNDSYKAAAEFFRHPDVIDPLEDRNPDLGTKHTNTFIPKVLGEIRRYELTGYMPSLELSRFFWDEMTAHHTFAPGCSSDKEHFFNPADFAKHISGYTGETCCTYNMLKLTRHLFCQNPDARFMEYYERALYNHILGQQDPQTGMVAYFLPLQTGTHRVYSTPNNSFWCCVGSGFESHAKYAEQVYSKQGDRLMVNLFVPTRLDWKEKGVTVTQNTRFPEANAATLTFNTAKPVKTGVMVRRPSWADNFEIKVNGHKCKTIDNGNGYLTIDRTWRDNDQVEITFDMGLMFEPTPDNTDKGAVVYGPLVMAARLGTEGMPAPAPYSDPSKYNDYYTYDYNIPDGLPSTIDLKKLRQTGPLKFEGPNGIVIEPLYDIHRERYAVYWDR